MFLLDPVEMLVPNDDQHHGVDARYHQVPPLVIKEEPDNGWEGHQEETPESEHEVANEAEL